MLSVGVVINLNVRTDLRVQNFDMLFIRLLHLLAHHPDFSPSVEGLQDMAK